MTQTVTSHRYYIGLLASLLAVFLISPFFGQGSYGSDLLGVALLMTLLFCVLVIGRSKHLLIVAALLSAPMMVESLGDVIAFDVPIHPLLSAICAATFVLLIISMMLYDMFRSVKVDGALIVGAISLYLLLALFWGFVYLAIEQLYPGSFHYTLLQGEMAQITPPQDSTFDLMYFSMITLTTLGYGDITPLSSPARAMASMQAVAGQMYLTVLVARLVGMHIAQKQ